MSNKCRFHFVLMLLAGTAFYLSGCCLFGTRNTVNIREARSGYPSEWWAPVNAEQKPWWEILPQEAKPGEVILSKRNELGILSNFAPTPFIYNGKWYASVEGFWQMMKYPEDENDQRARDKNIKWEYTRDSVARMSSFKAKEAGDKAEKNMKTLGITWVTFEGRKIEYRTNNPGEHYRLIRAAMEQKLLQNPEVREILLATSGLVLRPDHKQDPDSPPEWRYHEIWMQIRDTLNAK